jgi:hypothetical protein
MHSLFDRSIGVEIQNLTPSSIRVTGIEIGGIKTELNNVISKKENVSRYSIDSAIDSTFILRDNRFSNSLKLWVNGEDKFSCIIKGKRSISECKLKIDVLEKHMDCSCDGDFPD